MKNRMREFRSSGTVRGGDGNVPTYSAAEWVARQITEAFPWNEAPRYMVRDHDRGTVVARRLRAMGIRDKPIAPATLAERLC